MGFELERICANCNSFYTDPSDYNTSFGVCLNDPEIDVYFDEIMENNSAECCMELYQNKRYDNEKEACEDYDEIEADMFDDEIDIEMLDRKFEANRNMDLSELRPLVMSGESEKILIGLNSLKYYAIYRNPMAFTILSEYLSNLPPLTNIGQTHHWLDIISELERSNNHDMLSELFLQLLLKLESNNVTRQVFSRILRYYSRDCPESLAYDKLTLYLIKGRYGPRLKKRIEDILNPKETGFMYFGF